MGKKHWVVVFLFPVISLSALFSRESGALDYRREESPVISWNGLALFDTRCLSLAGISLFASSPSSQFLNPAHKGKGGFHAGGSLHFLGYQSFQYWGLNQGVIRSYQPLSEKRLNSGNLFVQASFHRWTVSAGYLSETPFLFPDYFRRVDYEDSQYYEISGEFSSRSHGFFAAAAMSDRIYRVNGRRYEYGAGARTIYPTNGDSDDWIYATFGCPAFTIELPPAADAYDSGHFFTPEEEIQRTFSEMLPAILHFCLEIIDAHPVETVEISPPERPAIDRRE